MNGGKPTAVLQNYAMLLTWRLGSHVTPRTLVEAALLGVPRSNVNTLQTAKVTVIHACTKQQGR